MLLRESREDAWQRLYPQSLAHAYSRLSSRASFETVARAQGELAVVSTLLPRPAAFTGIMKLKIPPARGIPTLPFLT